MKNPRLAGTLAALFVLSSAYAQKGTLEFPKPSPPQPPPSDYIVQPPPAPLNTLQTTEKQVYVYDQKPLQGRSPLVTQEQARTIISRFKQAYAKLGSPRLLIYVNRELVDQQPGMKLIHRTQGIEKQRTKSAGDAAPASSIKSTESNEYRADTKPVPTLADKQTTRDVERIFGRPLRDAGATLADQKVAAQLIGDKPLDEFIGSSDSPDSQKDREALSKIADAVIEVLISSKNVEVPTISGTQTISTPDIQATAISLKDSKILGQASSADVTSRLSPSSLGNFDVREITEATAFALMEDMAPAE
jgi:hypothetical protein